MSEAKGGMQELFDNKFQKKTNSNYELNLCRGWESNSRPPNGMKMGGGIGSITKSCPPIGSH